MRLSLENRYLILFANCIPVKGAKRSTICDLQRGGYHYIPNTLFEILQSINEKTLKQVYSEYGLENQKVLDEYFQFIIENDLGFLDDEPEIFPPLDLSWESPSEITNAIIDVDIKYFQKIDYEQVFSQLSSLNCTCIQIRFFNNFDIGALESLLNFTLDSRIKEVRLVLQHSSSIEKIFKDDLMEKHARIEQVMFFDALDNKVEDHLGVPLIYLNKSTLNEKDCGQICTNTFEVNVTNFTEAINFNSCLNRKISLDSRGNIKNCPSQAEDFGNISLISFSEVLKNNKFKHLWKIKKDDISICKDCEYRYICTDCRVFTQEDNNLSKPLKCTYDPYTVTWN